MGPNTLHMLNSCPTHLATAPKMWILQTWPTSCSVGLQEDLTVAISKVILLPGGVRCLQPTSFLTFRSLTMSISSSLMKLCLALAFSAPPCLTILLLSLLMPSYAALCSSLPGFFLAFESLCLILSLPLYAHSFLSSFSSISLLHSQQLSSGFHVSTLSPM